MSTSLVCQAPPVGGGLGAEVRATAWLALPLAATQLGQIAINVTDVLFLGRLGIQPLAAATEHLERAMIQHAMTLCHGRVEQVARMLGLSRKGLYLKRQRLKLDEMTM